MHLDQYTKMRFSHGVSCPSKLVTFSKCCLTERTPLCQLCVIRLNFEYSMNNFKIKSNKLYMNFFGANKDKF